MKSVNKNFNMNPPLAVDYEQHERKPFFTPTRVLFGGLALGALGYGAYKLFQWMNRNKNGSGDTNLFVSDEANSPTLSTEYNSVPSSGGTKPTGYSSSPASDFPIKKGSRSEKVRQLQQALITKYGKSILPKYGPDGQYGSELEKALTSKGLPTTIDEQQFTILTSVDTSDTATKLYNSAIKKDFPAALNSLQTLRNASDYKTVSEQFKLKRLNGVSTTLVTGMLGTFTDPTQKQQMQIEFSRMGLKYDGSKWSIPEGIAGLPAKQIIAVRPTQVWQNAKHPLTVGANTVLGREIASNGGITLFDTVDGFRLYVITGHVRYM